jgi:hypothetical protein
MAHVAHPARKCLHISFLSAFQIFFLPIWGTRHMMRDAAPRPCCAASGRLKNHPPSPVRFCLVTYKSTPLHMVWERLKWNLCAAKQALTGFNNCRDAAWFYATICRALSCEPIIQFQWLSKLTPLTLNWTTSQYPTVPLVSLHQRIQANSVHIDVASLYPTVIYLKSSVYSSVCSSVKFSKLMQILLLAITD